VATMSINGSLQVSITIVKGGNLKFGFGDPKKHIIERNDII